MIRKIIEYQVTPPSLSYFAEEDWDCKESKTLQEVIDALLADPDNLFFIKPTVCLGNIPLHLKKFVYICGTTCFCPRTGFPEERKLSKFYKYYDHSECENTQDRHCNEWDFGVYEEHRFRTDREIQRDNYRELSKRHTQGHR